MTNSITMALDSCANCHREVVEKLKTSSAICSGCFKSSTKDDPFPSWKEVDKTKLVDGGVTNEN